MAGFENGRIQTAARAVGVMQAAYDAALEYARSAWSSGEALIEYELTRVKFGTMAAIIQCSRQFSLEVAREMGAAAARSRPPWPRPTSVARPSG
jgi:(2S)-methylsuccinyl-CoA dehydrogenase